MTNYSRGADFERRIASDLADNGFTTIRASGSHGIADIVALKRGLILMVQCKINGRISPADRHDLADIAHKAGGIALVAHRPSPRKLAYRRLVDPQPRGGLYTPYVLDTLAEAQKC